MCYKKEVVIEIIDRQNYIKYQTPIITSLFLDKKNPLESGGGIMTNDNWRKPGGIKHFYLHPQANTAIALSVR